MKSWFQAPAQPPVAPRIRIDPAAGPVRLGLAIIRSAGWYAIAGAALLVVFNAASMLLPVALGEAVDSGIAPLLAGTPWGEAIGPFLAWLGVIAGLYLAMNLTYRFGGRLGWYGVQRAQFELSERVLSRVLDPRGIDGPTRLPGSLLAVATLDAQRACLALYVAIYPLGELVAIVVAAASLLAIHPLLGVGVIVGAPVLLGIMAVIATPLHRRSITEQERVADATAAATDLVEGYRVLAGIHAQGTAATRYRHVSRAALHGTLAARTAQGGFEGVNTALTGLFAAAVTVAAAALAFTGQIGIGGLIAAAGIAQVLLAPLQSLVGQAGSFWAVAMASARRILDLLGAPTRSDRQGTGIPPVTGEPELTLDALPLGSATLSLHADTGEFLVLDLTGADQAVLVDALTLSGAEPASLAERISLRGARLTDLHPALLREQLLVAPHRADLFDDSILDNVSPSADDHVSARAALTVACCESLEGELPEGYDTSVGEGGTALSGGQRQRVALARAIAADAPVLVLHEPTNAVDSVTEAEIAHRVRQARRGRTTIVLTSSPAFHAVADRVPTGAFEGRGTS